MRILLIEDDEDDILLFKHAMDDNNITYTTDEVMEGDGITAYLEECTIMPDIIVMDLNLPKKHGREVLKEIKGHPAFVRVPVVVLSTTTNPIEIELMLNMGANRFITKPSNKVGYDAAVAVIVGEVGKN